MGCCHATQGGAGRPAAGAAASTAPAAAAGGSASASRQVDSAAAARSSQEAGRPKAAALELAAATAAAEKALGSEEWRCLEAKGHEKKPGAASPNGVHAQNGGGGSGHTLLAVSGGGAGRASGAKAASSSKSSFAAAGTSPASPWAPSAAERALPASEEPPILQGGNGHGKQIDPGHFVAMAAYGGFGGVLRDRGAANGEDPGAGDDDQASEHEDGDRFVNLQDVKLAFD